MNLARIYILQLVILFLGCRTNNTDTTSIDTDQFTIAFGSCNHQWEDQPMWSTISKNNPDLWIWTGDIIYSDTEDMSKMKDDYLQQDNNPDYANFKNQIPIIGIWDDHDYGANNSGKEYLKKDSSKLLLFEFLDVPRDNLAWNRKGAYQSYTYHSGNLNIKILLLDARYFRDSRGDGNGTILGEEQWQWLEQELSVSNADVHILVSGIQILPIDHRFEKWANIGDDRQRLLSILKGTKEPILISGDRHLAEISQWTDNQNHIVEITSSGLTHSYSDFQEEENRYRVGDVYPFLNFGLITFVKEKAQTSWTAEVRGADNKTTIQFSSE